MEKQSFTKKEAPKEMSEKPCHHPYLKTERKTANKVCTSCGRVIYSGEHKLQTQFSQARGN